MGIMIIGKPVRIRYSHLYCDADEEMISHWIKSEKVFLRKMRSQETCRYESVYFWEEEIEFYNELLRLL